MMREKGRLFTLIVTLVLTVFNFAYGNDFLGWLLLFASGGHLAMFFLGNDKVKASLLVQVLTVLLGLIAILLNPDALLPYLVGLAFISGFTGLLTYFWLKKRKDNLDEKE